MLQLNERGDFPVYLPDELILIIMGFLVAEPILWRHKDGHGSIESQRSASICKQVGNFSKTCRRFHGIAQDLLFWKHANIPSGFTGAKTEQFGSGVLFHEVPVPVHSLRHARLLFQPQTLYRVWRPGVNHRITAFEGETQTGDVLFCKHIIPPTAAEGKEPTRDFYQTRASYEHAYFPGRCYSIFYSVYASTQRAGPFHRMNCYSKEKFHTQFVARLRVDAATRNAFLKRLCFGEEAVFAASPDLWFTVKRVDLLQKPRREKSQKAL